MASLKPWYRVVTPREDLREGKPLDASEFAVHLEQVRDGRAPTDYQKPERFRDKVATAMTQRLETLDPGAALGDLLNVLNHDSVAIIVRISSARWT